MGQAPLGSGRNRPPRGVRAILPAVKKRPARGDAGTTALRAGRAAWLLVAATAAGACAPAERASGDPPGMIRLAGGES